MKFGYCSPCSAGAPGPAGAERTPRAARRPVSATLSTSPRLCRALRGIAPLPGSAPALARHPSSSSKLGEMLLGIPWQAQGDEVNTLIWVARGSDGSVRASCCLSMLGEPSPSLPAGSAAACPLLVRSARGAAVCASVSPGRGHTAARCGDRRMGQCWFMARGAVLLSVSPGKYTPEGTTGVPCDLDIPTSLGMRYLRDTSLVFTSQSSGVQPPPPTAPPVPAETPACP